MEQGKKIELSEAEKEQIRERLSRYLAQAAYDCEDPADNGTVRTSIEPEDNYTIYKAVQSGDESSTGQTRSISGSRRQNTCRMSRT